MSRLGPIIIGLGVLTVVIRAPLLIAPQTTLRVFRRLIRTPARVRAFGLGLLLCGVALGLAVRAEPGFAARGLEWFGWIAFAGAGLGLVAFPRSAQRFVESILHAVSDSGILRALGALSVGVGLLLIYLGVPLF